MCVLFSDDCANALYYHLLMWLIFYFLVVYSFLISTYKYLSIHPSNLSVNVDWSIYLSLLIGTFTELMQDSLGGNAKTLMFVNFSPADYNADETSTSLMYASRVKKIVNNASKVSYMGVNNNNSATSILSLTLEYAWESIVVVYRVDYYINQLIIMVIIIINITLLSFLSCSLSKRRARR